MTILGAMIYLLFVATIWPLDGNRFFMAVALLMFAAGTQSL